MSSLPTTNDTVSCKERFDCQEAPYRNTHHCVFHFPGEEKADDFNRAFRKRARGSDFKGFWFPEKAPFDFNFDEPLIFSEATFNGEIRFEAGVFKRLVKFDFTIFNQRVTFRKTTFEQVNFSSAIFKGAVTFARADFQGDANFNSTVFEEDASFSFFEEGKVKLPTLFKGKADFSEARFIKYADFRGVILEHDANFYLAKFSSTTNFSDAEFKGIANFGVVTFEGRTNFNAVTFEQTCSFHGATFEDRVVFDATMFNGAANFMLAHFKDSLRFKGFRVFDPKSAPNLKETRFDNPEMVTFHSITLRPYWFVDVNASGFTMTDVAWDLGSIDREIEGIAQNYEGVTSPYPLLGIACWNLAVNAEENHRYEEASTFRYLAMDARRRSTARPKSSARMLHWLYWRLSGYGERMLQAFIVLIGIWLLFAFIYALTLNDKEGKPLRLRALTYSAAVIMLQKPEPVPATPTLHGLVILETVLGPVQAALLALAIRRKFMR